MNESPRTFRLPAAAPGPSAAPARYRMTVAYDGTRYAGWQVQPGHPSIQQAVEEALLALTQTRPRVHSSGRTDAGVHAHGQVAHFDLPGAADARKLLRGLNALLPDDIRVLALRAAPPEFHARYWAVGKEYRYFIWNGDERPPHRRLYCALVRRPLDARLMNEAAARLEGRHDFAAFSANPNREIDGTVRTLRSLEVRKSGREFRIDARGDGFLYKMVRSLAGFLIRVGVGDVPPAAATEILQSKLRTARVPTAAPEGLFLWRVDYGDGPAPRPGGGSATERPRGEEPVE